MTGKLEQSSTVCARKDCTFYGRPVTGTCDYRTITGRRRGCPIADCNKYTTEPYKPTNSGKFNPDTKIRESEKKGAQDMNAIHNWDVIRADYNTGTNNQELSEKYGVNITTINKKIREWKIERGEPVKTRKKKTQSTDNAAVCVLAAPERSENPTVPAEKWYAEDLARIVSIAEQVRPGDDEETCKDFVRVMMRILAQMVDRRAEFVEGGN